MYRDIITLFNYHAGQWRATVLPGVDLNADRAAMIAKYGADCKDRALLHVRFTPSAQGPIVKGRGGSLLVTEPRAYAGAAGTVAFRPAITGEVFDFFLEGVWDGEPVIDDEEYDAGFYDYLNATRDGVYTISATARYSVIPHYEVTAR